MGIQIGIDKSDVEHLIAEEDGETYDCGACFECVEEFGKSCRNSLTVLYYKLQHKDVSVWVSGDPESNYLWVDANHWGSNREKILYILNENNIEYIEG